MHYILEQIRAVPGVFDAIGILGFLIYIASFKLVQTGHLDGNGILYPASNVVAAFCVLLSLAVSFNFASFLIQVSYILIGLYGIAVRWRKRGFVLTDKTCHDVAIGPLTGGAK